MSIGSYGEDLAERFLINKGYKILERNFRCRLGEIDIIAMDGTVLVFIEVKTRRNQKFGLPCEAITSEKFRHLKKAATYYAMVSSMETYDMRIDVIEILIKGGKHYLHHLENAQR
ncbi:MAG: YraN family protein [Anaerovoracaceae bacterium]|jgi:putative endonuclease|nr:YraN family protein [Clostridiales bacterium]